MQVQKLEAELEQATLEKRDLTEALEMKQKESDDQAKKDTLRFNILLDMFGLYLLQSEQASEVMKE